MKKSFDEHNTLTLVDLRQLDEIHFELLKIRASLARFVSCNPQLSWHDVGYISDVDESLDSASTRLGGVCTLLRNKVYDACGSARVSPSWKFDTEYDV